jgi:hypothetical protein
VLVDYNTHTHSRSVHLPLDLRLFNLVGRRLGDANMLRKPPRLGLRRALAMVRGSFVKTKVFLGLNYIHAALCEKIVCSADLCAHDSIIGSNREDDQPSELLTSPL